MSSGARVLDLAGPAGDLASPVHRLDPRAKTAGLFGVTVVAVSTPLGLWPVWAACAAVLAAVAAAARVGPRALWRRGRLVLVPVLAVALVVPLVREGGAAWALGPLTVHEAGLAVLSAVAAKALIGIAAAALFTATTTLPAALRGLEALRVPGLLVLIAGLLYRYLFVVAGEAGRMRAALVARGYAPRNALQAGVLGRAVAALFLRSYARGERVHRAMLARGHVPGTTRALDPLAFGRSDALFVVAVALALVPLRAVLGAAG